MCSGGCGGGKSITRSYQISGLTREQRLKQLAENIQKKQIDGFNVSVRPITKKPDAKT